MRERIGRKRVTEVPYRVGVGLVGGVVLALGIVIIPYPGPGWFTVFAGLAILATEFAWARRLLRFARARYDEWGRWLRRQRPAVRLLALAFTGLVVIVTLWLINTFGLVGGWFGLEWPWMRSPFA